MKSFKNKICSLFVAAAFFCTFFANFSSGFVYAEAGISGDEIFYAYVKDGVLTVGGNTGKYCAEECGILTVVKKGEALNAGVGDSEKVLHIQMVKTDSNGVFCETLPFDDNKTDYVLNVDFGEKGSFSVALPVKKAVFAKADYDVQNSSGELLINLGDLSDASLLISFGDKSKEVFANGENVVRYALGAVSAKSVSAEGESISVVLSTELVANKNLIFKNLDFGLPKVLGDLPGETIYEQYRAAKEELPNEVPQMAVCEPKGTVEIFVSPLGDDTGDGTADSPLKTVAEGIKRLKACDKSGGAVLWLRGGRYTVSPLSLSGLLGTEENPVFISAYGGEEVVLTSGTSSEELERPSAEVLKKIPKASREHIRVVNLKTVGFENFGDEADIRKTISVFDENNIFSPSRYPKTGETGASSVISSKGAQSGTGFSFVPADTSVLKWNNSGDILIEGFFSSDWNRETHLVKEITQSGLVSATDSTTNDKSVDVSKNYIKYHYLNAFECLSMPGEYVVDKTSGLLYVYPFEEEGDIYVSGGDSPLFGLDSLCEYVYFNGLDFENMHSSGISISGAKGCRIQRCGFKNIKESAATISNGSFNGIIFSNFSNCGDSYSAVSIGGTFDVLCQNVPCWNYLQNCCVFNEKNSTNLVAVNSANGAVVSHNLLCGAGNDAITSGWSRELIIEYNEILNTGLNVADSGAIYLAGTMISQGVHIRYNYIHDLYKYNSGVNINAIYLDDFSSHKFVYGNICEEGNIYIHGGRENVVENNITTECIWIKSDMTQDSRLENWKYGQIWTGHSDYSKNRTSFEGRYKRLGEYLKKYEKYLAGDTSVETEIREARENVLYNNVANCYLGGTNVNTWIAAKAQETLVGLASNKLDTKLSSSRFSGGALTEAGRSLIESETKNMSGFYVPDAAKMKCGNSYGKKLGSPKTLFAGDGLFKWSDADGAYYYKIDISQSENFETLLESKTTDDSTYVSDLTFENEKTYWYRVTAFGFANDLQSETAQSEPASFKTFGTNDDVEVLLGIKNGKISGEINSLNGAVKGIAVAAAYKDDVLSEVEFSQSFSLQKTGDGAKIEIELEKSGYTSVKVFLFENLTNLMPIYKTYVIK